MVGSKFFPSKENSINIDKLDIRRLISKPLVFAFFTIGSYSDPVIRFWILKTIRPEEIKYKNVGTNLKLSSKSLPR